MKNFKSAQVRLRKWPSEFGGNLKSVRTMVQNTISNSLILLKETKISPFATI